jgi:hypothetical protein
MNILRAIGAILLCVALIAVIAFVVFEMGDGSNLNPFTSGTDCGTQTGVQQKLCENFHEERRNTQP